MNLEFIPNTYQFIPTGFKDLDNHIIGYENSNLYVIGARPGMGNTCFLINSVMGALKKNIPCAFVPLKNTSRQVVDKIGSSLTDIPFEKFRKRDIEDYEYELIAHRCSHLPLYFLEEGKMNILELERKIFAAKEKQNIGAVFIDDFQHLLPSTPQSTREQELSINIRALKTIARQLDIPIILTTELNRSVETRGGDKRPIYLTDIRDSGAIEDTADVIMFLYRPEYYGITEDESGLPISKMVEVICKKNTHGKEFSFWLKYEGNYCRMRDDEFLFADYGIPSEFQLPNTITISSKVNPHQEDDDEEEPF